MDKKIKSIHSVISRAVVTGGLGMIGSVLCKQLLEKGIEVTAIDNFKFGRRPEALPSHKLLKIYKADITDKKELNKIFAKARPEAVFHLAAIAFIPRCMSHPAETIDVNIGGTKNVFEAAKKVGVRHVFFASTADVYSTNTKYLSEKSEIDPPPDVYGMSKYVGELMAESYFRSTKGVAVTAGRFFNVYGQHPTNRFLIPAIHEQLGTGKDTIELGNLNVERDYTHASDIARAVLMLVANNKNSFQAVNIGSGRATSVRELVKIFADITQRKIKVISKKTKMRPIDRFSWRADRGLIKKLVGWEPQISLEDGLRPMLGEI